MQNCLNADKKLLNWKNSAKITEPISSHQLVEVLGASFRPGCLASLSYFLQNTLGVSKQEWWTLAPTVTWSGRQSNNVTLVWNRTSSLLKPFTGHSYKQSITRIQKRLGQHLDINCYGWKWKRFKCTKSIVTFIKRQDLKIYFDSILFSLILRHLQLLDINCH